MSVTSGSMKKNDFKIQVTTKEKRQGRPSKKELLASALLSCQMDNPEIERLFEDAVTDIILYGHADTTELMAKLKKIMKG